MGSGSSDTVPSLLLPPPVDGEERRGRPGGLLFLVGLVFVQGLLLGLLGTLVLLGRGETSFREAVPWSGTDVVFGVVTLAVGAIAIVVAVLLARGSEPARSVFGFLTVWNIAVGVYTVIVARLGVTMAGLAVVVVSVGILWVLYGPEQTRTFFQS